VHARFEVEQLQRAIKMSTQVANSLLQSDCAQIAQRTSIDFCVPSCFMLTSKTLYGTQLIFVPAQMDSALSSATKQCLALILCTESSHASRISTGEHRTQSCFTTIRSMHRISSQRVTVVDS